MTMLTTRRRGSVEVTAIGLGCMNLSHAYGRPPPADAGRRILLRALELGVTHVDCAALYGFGSNESLLGDTLPPYRNRIFLTSKCGMTGVDGKRVIDGRPAALKRPAYNLTTRTTMVFDRSTHLVSDPRSPIREATLSL